jgi:hypothetical protein
MVLADRTVVGLKMISYTHVEIRKNIFLKGRESVDDMSFNWKPQNNGDQVTNCLSIVNNTCLDINLSQILFPFHLCTAVRSNFSFLSFVYALLDTLLYYSITPLFNISFSI